MGTDKQEGTETSDRVRALDHVKARGDLIAEKVTERLRATGLLAEDEEIVFEIAKDER